MSIAERGRLAAPRNPRVGARVVAGVGVRRKLLSRNCPKIDGAAEESRRGRSPDLANYSGEAGGVLGGSAVDRQIVVRDETHAVMVPPCASIARRRSSHAAAVAQKHTDSATGDVVQNVPADSCASRASIRSVRQRPRRSRPYTVDTAAITPTTPADTIAMPTRGKGTTLGSGAFELYFWCAAITAVAIPPSASVASTTGSTPEHFAVEAVSGAGTRMPMKEHPSIRMPTVACTPLPQLSIGS